MKKYYKLCDISTGEAHSICHYLKGCTLQRKYSEGIVVSAWKSSLGILFFDSLENAIYFGRTKMRDLGRNNMAIFEISPLTPVSRPKLALYSCYLDVAFWPSLAKSMRALSKETGYKPPKGTLAAHKVKVIRKLTQAEFDNAWTRGAFSFHISIRN
jgi:hypothetical protein